MKREIYKFGNYDFEVIAMKLLNLQVCSNCPPSEMDKIEIAVKEQYPAGTTHNWHLLKEGSLAPVECSNGGRWHYLFEC